MAGRPPARGPSAAELLRSGTGFLTRSHLRDLGLERRAIDGIFRALDVVVWPGYSRPMIRVEDFLQLQERSSFRDGERVRSRHT